MQTGLLAGLPFLCRYIGAVVFGTLSDCLVSRKVIKIATARRIFSAVGKRNYV